MKKIHPGISTFASNPSAVGHDHLKKLYKHALKIVPASQVQDTPVYLLATAGMRLLTESEQTSILAEACAYTKEHTDFLVPECESHFQVISGETEGLYGWIAINYLLGGFDHKPDGRHHTYGFLDMGGASAQIAFVPNKTEAAAHAPDLTLLRLRTLAGDTKEWQVFVSTWLGFGANEARRRYIQNLVSHDRKDKSIDDPCMPSGLIEEVPRTISSSTAELSLIGTGDLNQCLTALEPLLSKDAPCPDAPCLFAGVHAPSIDFDVNHFIGISEYYYSTQDVFGLGGAYDYHTLSEAVKRHCSRSWSDILDDLAQHKFPAGVKQSKLEDVCFKASWMMNVVHDGIGIPRITKETSQLETGHNGTEEIKEGARLKGFDGAFNSAESLAGTEVSWTLGKMLLYSSSGVETSDKNPVGFGPNLQDASTFHVAGEVGPAGIAFGVPSVSAGFAQQRLSALAFIVLVIGLLLCTFRISKKSGYLQQIWSQGRRRVIGARGDQSYERILEDGDLDQDRFELTRMGKGGYGQKSTVSFSNGMARSASQMRLQRSSREDIGDDKLA